MTIPEEKLKACLAVLYEATLRARCLGWDGDRNGLSVVQARQLAKLTDAVHNLPYLILNWEQCDEDQLLKTLARYDRTYSSPDHGLVDVYQRAGQKPSSRLRSRSSGKSFGKHRK